MSDLLLLCWEFFKTGLFAVGGGMATIPFLTQMAERYPQWFDLQMLTDMVAIAESTPGPIGVNMATYAGYTAYGIPGALLATASLVLPSFLVMLLIFRALERYRSNPIVDAGFSGLRPAVTGLIGAAAYAVMKMALLRDGVLDWGLLSMFLVFFAAMQLKPLKKLHPVVYIAVAAVLGVVFEL